MISEKDYYYKEYSLARILYTLRVFTVPYAINEIWHYVIQCRITEIMIRGTLRNSKDPDEMLHNVAFIVKVYMVSEDKIPLTERYTCTRLLENDSM